VNVLLRLAEWPYRGINRLRRGLYRAGVLRSKRLPKPVISVGNIAAGGAGKTPAVIAIARFLSERGLHVVVLTRGYGRSGAGGPVDALDPERFGDEPVLIKKSIPDVDVIVGSNRYDNGLSVTGDVYLLDDGFQHLQLHRDLDVVIDAPNAPFHREGRSALRHAGIVIPRRIRPAGLEALSGRRLFAFAGLADNEQFFAMLRVAGVDLAGTRSFDDHHRYSDGDLLALRAAAGGNALVTTEKDAVKIGARDIIAVPIVFEIDDEVLAMIEGVARGRAG
jgi:tetraacyldisaccharide 4'-kinase